MNCKKYFALNKIIVHECAFFCNQCWKHRNEIAQDEEKQREWLANWHEKEKNKAQNSKHNQVRMCAQRSKLDENRYKCDTIKRWILNLKNIEKKVEKMPQNDIR